MKLEVIFVYKWKTKDGRWVSLKPSCVNDIIKGPCILSWLLHIMKWTLNCPSWERFGGWRIGRRTYFMELCFPCSNFDHRCDLILFSLVCFGDCTYKRIGQGVLQNLIHQAGNMYKLWRKIYQNWDNSISACWYSLFKNRMSFANKDAFYFEVYSNLSCGAKVWGKYSHSGHKTHVISYPPIDTYT